MEEGSCSSSSDVEKECMDADVVPDELMELAKDTMTFMDNENVNNQLDVNKSNSQLTRKRKRQRARSVAVRTLFVSKLPVDATAREIYLLFVRFKGFQGSVLKHIKGRTTEQSTVAFVMFRKRDQAEQARVEINGLKYDPTTSRKIQADYARANNNAAKIKELKRTRWDEDVPTLKERDPASRPQDTVQYPPSVPAAPAAPTAVVYATADSLWCHHPQPQQLSPQTDQSQQHAHILQLQPPIPPTQNYTMMPMTHPPPMIITTTPYLPPPPPPPMTMPPPVAKPCCAYAQQDMAEAMKKCTLFVANMGMETSEDELMAVFTRLPSFKRLKMLRNKERTPVAFIEYEDHHAACQAKTLFNGKTLFTSNENGGIRIEFAKKPMIDAKWKLNYG